VADEQERTARAEKMLGDFQEQAGRPYEHEAQLKGLLARQAELNAALDLDKGERQIAPPAGAEGSAGVDGDAGADDRAAGADTRPERQNGGPRRDGSAPNDGKNLDGTDPKPSARRQPSVPGTKF
jgi:hypothetical protein